jgi:hypothetical protein
MDIKKPKNKWWLDPQNVPEAAQRAPMSAAPSGMPNAPVTPGNTNVTIVLPLMDKASKPRAPKTDNTLPFRATTPPGGNVIGQEVGGLTPQVPGYTGLGNDGVLQKSNPTSTDLLQRHEGEYVLTADEVNRMGGPQGVESWKHQGLVPGGPAQNAQFTPRLYTQENGGYVQPMSHVLQARKVVMQDVGGQTTPAGTIPDPNKVTNTNATNTSTPSTGTTPMSFNPTAVPGLTQPQSNTVMKNYTDMATGKMFEPQHLANVEGVSDLSRQNNANVATNVAAAGLTNQGAGKAAMQGANQQNVQTVMKSNLADEQAKNQMQLTGSQALASEGANINAEKWTTYNANNSEKWNTYNAQIATGDYAGAQNTVTSINQTAAAGAAAMSKMSKFVAANMDWNSSLAAMKADPQTYNELIKEYGSDAGIKQVFDSAVWHSNTINQAAESLHNSDLYRNASPTDKAQYDAVLTASQNGSLIGSFVPDGYNPDGTPKVRFQLTAPTSAQAQAGAYSQYKNPVKNTDGSYTFTDANGQKTAPISAATVAGDQTLSRIAGVTYTAPKTTGTQGAPGFKFASQGDQDAAWAQFKSDAQASGDSSAVAMNESDWLNQYGAPQYSNYKPWTAAATYDTTTSTAPNSFNSGGGMWTAEGKVTPLTPGQNITISGQNATIQNSSTVIPVGDYTVVDATHIQSRLPDKDGKFTTYDTTGTNVPVKGESAWETWARTGLTAGFAQGPNKTNSGTKVANWMTGGLYSLVGGK